MFVTEDTTRARPETIDRLYTTAIECGAERICVCDTVGHATPEGVRSLLSFVKEVVARTGRPVKIDWHGHRDRGLDIPNTLAAIEAGADRVHGCALGIGERCGNTPMDILLVNLKLMGWISNDLSRLPDYCRTVSEATGVPVPISYPVVGADAFRTGTGVHAAAVIKALKKGDRWLADRVYSGVPAGEFGLRQRIEIGPMSGLSNVQHWLSERGIPPKEDLVKAVFEAAKRSNRVLTNAEIEALVKPFLD
jgi:2-isopropylmalate synthase